MAIDTDKTKNSLFGNIKRPVTQTKKMVSDEKEQSLEHVEEKAASLAIEEVRQAAVPEVKTKAKWQNMDKVTALLTTEQKEGLDAVAKSLMRYRATRTKGTEKERITSNTILRALIDAFLDKKDSYPLEVLITEEDVKKWIKSNN